VRFSATVPSDHSTIIHVPAFLDSLGEQLDRL
jgi:hypothetical protein